jgi:pimeloyl-ACP methyl ester carboxylesterase
MAETRMTEKSLEVEENWQIAYQWRPAQKPSHACPIVFLNGLGDTYHAWTPFMSKLPTRHRLQVDLRGQGKSLAHRLAHDSNSDFRISVETQSRDLLKLLDTLKIEQVDIAAFSYGGGVAFDFATRFPNRVRRLASIVPFILRLDRSFPLQRLMSWQWNTARTFGLIPQSLGHGLEQAYEKFLSAYMNQRYESRLSNAEHRRVAIELTYGIMKFNAFEVLEHLPLKSVYLLTGDCDTLVPTTLYQEFWRRLPDEKRGTWTRINDGEHLLLEQKPEIVEQWLRSVLNENPV